MKRIVFESLNEVISFERRKDPLSTLGIGQRKLIEDWLKEMDITDYKINNDLTINVNTTVDLKRKNLKKLPQFIQFNKIIGFYFHISMNQLITLRGCPFYVYGNFSCQDNKLISLEGCPKYVKGDFRCGKNLKQFTIKDVKEYCDVKDENIQLYYE